MESQNLNIIGPTMKGVVIKIGENANGLYDGVIKCGVNNEYAYFDVPKFLHVGTCVNFNVISSPKNDENSDDFNAINVEPILQDELPLMYGVVVEIHRERDGTYVNYIETADRTVYCFSDNPLGLIFNSKVTFNAVHYDTYGDALNIKETAEF